MKVLGRKFIQKSMNVRVFSFMFLLKPNRHGNNFQFRVSDKDATLELRTTGFI